MMRSFFEYLSRNIFPINISNMNRILVLFFFLFSATPILIAQDNGGWEYFVPEKDSVNVPKKEKKKEKVAQPKQKTKVIPQVLCYSTYKDFCEGNGYNVFNMSMLYYTRPNTKWWELNEYRFSVPAEEEIESITFKTFAVQIDSVLYVNMQPYKGFGRIYKRVKVMPNGSLLFVNDPKAKRLKYNPSVYPLAFGAGALGGAIGGALVGALSGSMKSSERNTLEDLYCYVLDPLSKKVNLVDEEILKSILADKMDVFDSYKARLNYDKYNASIVMRVLNKAGIVADDDISGVVSAK